jgi:hypothetical protein
MRAAAIWILAVILCSGLAVAQPSAKPDPLVVKKLREYIRAHNRSPEEYVIAQFRDHDVVLLGEHHRVRQNILLVQRLIPLLYQAGVRTLATEFARRVDQPDIDSLLVGPKYDEALARSIVFRHNPLWGYQEYVDVLKAAWSLNHSLPKGSPPFLILALNNSPDWRFLENERDRNNGQVMAKVWHGETEKDWADALLKQVVDRGGKALVHCGAHHSFTRYRQPVVRNGRFIRFGDVRMGNHVYQAIGERAFSICLHRPWVGAEGYDAPPVLPADGYIDAALCSLAKNERRVGFDVTGSPFAKLPGELSLYKFGDEHFTLGAMCDGYIYQEPFKDFEWVTPIRGFVNDGNLEYARGQSDDPSLRSATQEAFFAEMARIPDDARARLPDEAPCPK